MIKPDDNCCIEDCPDCAGSGFQPDSQVECMRCNGHGKIYLHVWGRMTACDPDGTEFKKCLKCKVEVEV
jgi:DnaJ-class molecular chaperone